MATTTPNYSWPVPTSTDLVKDGATAIEALGDAIDATVYGLNPGLVLIKTQTIGTTVTSVNVTSAFSATYDNYKIILSGGVASALVTLTFKLGATATGYYMGYGRVVYSSGAANPTSDNNGTAFDRLGYGNTNTLFMTADLFNPFATKNTIVNGVIIQTDTSGLAGAATGFLNNTTSYTDFTIASSGVQTMTGGTISVYGYKK
jgi:hypothetical protein